MILGLAIVIVLFCAFLIASRKNVCTYLIICMILSLRYFGSRWGGGPISIWHSYLTFLHTFIGISTGGIIGIAIGVIIAVLVGVIVAIVIIVMARKLHRNHQQHGSVRT